MPASPHILVAEDDDSMRVSLLLLLESIGYQADGVADGGEAFLAIEQTDYDAVISDVNMPKINGLELYERLHESSHGLCNRVVFITSEPHLIPNHLKCTILRKPFNLASLRLALEKALGIESDSLEQT